MVLHNFIMNLLCSLNCLHCPHLRLSIKPDCKYLSTWKYKLNNVRHHFRTSASHISVLVVDTDMIHCGDCKGSGHIWLWPDVVELVSQHYSIIQQRWHSKVMKVHLSELARSGSVTQLSTITVHSICSSVAALLAEEDGDVTQSRACRLNLLP